jgi:flagellar biosynthetic protein FlhB
MSEQSSGEKTEKASPKKKEEARKRGEVHISHDAVTAVSMTVIFALIGSGYAAFAQKLGAYLKARLSAGYVLTQVNNLTPDMISQSYKQVLTDVLPIVLPFLLIVMVMGVALHIVQTGPLVTTERLKPDPKKLNPMEGFKRLFSMRTVMEMLKSVGKIGVMGYVIYKTFKELLSQFPLMMSQRPVDAFSQAMDQTSSMGVRMGGTLVALAAVDIFYQWWKYEKDLRMTKQEVKEENKQMEGDPQIKGKRRQLQRRMSQQRMMQNLQQQADVVVMNPTHFAVALRYKENVDAAPTVVAKGQDSLALRIRKVAEENKITVVENPPVARALYASCEIGQTIPPEMYQAIADILIYVYKVTGKMPDRK